MNEQSFAINAENMKRGAQTVLETMRSANHAKENRDFDAYEISMNEVNRFAFLLRQLGMDVALCMKRNEYVGLQINGSFYEA